MMDLSIVSYSTVHHSTLTTVQYLDVVSSQSKIHFFAFEARWIKDLFHGGDIAILNPWRFFRPCPVGEFVVRSSSIQHNSPQHTTATEEDSIISTSCHIITNMCYCSYYYFTATTTDIQGQSSQLIPIHSALLYHTLFAETISTVRTSKARFFSVPSSSIIVLPSESIVLQMLHSKNL